MGLGEILFTEEGTLEFPGNTLPVGDTKVTFESKVTGVGSFPSGKNKGKGTITVKPNGKVVASYEGELTPGQGRPISWTSREKSEKKGREVKGLEEVRGFSQQIVMDTEMLSDKKFANTGYEWT